MTSYIRRPIQQRVISSAGSERCLDRAEVQYDPPENPAFEPGFFMLHTPRTKSPHQGRLRSIVLDEFSTMDLKRLSDLEAHERGTLTKIDAPEGMLALMEMGCTVGEDIEVRHIAPLGDPMAVSAGGHVVALRRAQADQMWVKPLS